MRLHIFSVLRHLYLIILIHVLIRWRGIQLYEPKVTFLRGEDDVALMDVGEPQCVAGLKVEGGQKTASVGLHFVFVGVSSRGATLRCYHPIVNRSETVYFLHVRVVNLKTEVQNISTIQWSMR